MAKKKPTEAAKVIKKTATAKAVEVVTERPPHYFLGEDVLTPNVNKCDGSRLNMFTGQIGQALTLNEGEIPKVFSRFENQVGKYSHGMGYTQLTEDATFIGTVEFNENNAYHFFLYGDESVGVFHHTSVSRLTENYGHKNVRKMPEMEFGDTLEAGTLLERTNMYDDGLNLKYGVNLNVLFLAKDGLTFEDGIPLSASGAKKFSHTSVTEADIVVNNNDVLLNLYGDKGRHQPFPTVGQKIKGGILAARRRINYSSILNDFKENGATIERTDTCFFFDGVIEDIEVFSNFAEKDLAYTFNEPIRVLIEHNKAKYQELEDMITQFKENGWTLRDDVGFLFQKAKDYNSGIKFSQDRSEFEGAVLRFKIRKDHGIYIGSKITGRYGNKGVISAIIPDDQMPRTADGRIPDVVLNPLGVTGRMNIAQLFEQELNFIANEIILKAKSVVLERNYWLFNAILEFFEILNPLQRTELLEFADTQPDSDEFIDAYCEAVFEKGLYIHQPPFFENATPQIMSNLYNHFGINKLKFEGLLQAQILGDMYFIQLKHEAASKFSVRSAGQISLLNVPFKSNEQYKKGTAMNNSSPIRFGEQETFNMLMLSNGPEGSKPIVNFLRHYSSHNVERRNQIVKLLRNDIQNINRVNIGTDTENTITNAAQVIRSYFSGIGITMENEGMEEEALETLQDERGDEE
jgi:hypothetical protein